MRQASKGKVMLLLFIIAAVVGAGIEQATRNDRWLAPFCIAIVVALVSWLRWEMFHEVCAGCGRTVSDAVHASDLGWRIRVVNGTADWRCQGCRLALSAERHEEMLADARKRTTLNEWARANGLPGRDDLPPAA